MLKVEWTSTWSSRIQWVVSLHYQLQSMNSNYCMHLPSPPSSPSPCCPWPTVVCRLHYPAHSGAHSTGAGDVDCCCLQEAVQRSVEWCVKVWSAVWGCGVLCEGVPLPLQSPKRLREREDTSSLWHRCPTPLHSVEGMSLHPSSDHMRWRLSFLLSFMSCVYCNSVEQSHTLYAV